MKRFASEQVFRLILLLGVLSFCACSEVKLVEESPQEIEQQEKVFHVIRQQTAKPGELTPPFRFHGDHNFILHPKGKTYYYTQYINRFCGTGVDYSKPDFLRLSPSSLVELDEKALEILLQQIDSTLTFNPYVLFTLASPNDTITQKHFKIIYDFMAEEERVPRFIIRKMTEEERVVLHAKLKDLPYDPDTVNWKEEFGGERFVPPHTSVN